MTDADFMDWVVNRFQNVHGESKGADFMIRLRKIADEMRTPAEDNASFFMLAAAARSRFPACSAVEVSYTVAGATIKNRIEF